eukprot:TRINITY_DN16364_c0_g1_i1.p1 TRINITY_DN16364_c0_g1~~TRINITY_DN16364_c0_g1_i1.p1  ORF type:complete len:217 (+),score=32.27 TRINITY_DN16364_c0_g1_i1:44-694(+)
MTLAVAPTPELLRLRPRFKLSVFGLAVVFILDLVAGFDGAALVDAATLLPAVIALRRNVAGFTQGLLPISMLAAVNFFCQMLTLAQILTGRPGAKHFFQTECYSQVTADDDAGQHTVNLCSWRTVLGNISICASIAFQMFCSRYAWKIVKSMEQARQSTTRQASQTSDFLDIEGGTFGLPPSAAGSLLDPNAQRPRSQNSEQGFTPYSGRAYHLGD